MSLAIGVVGAIALLLLMMWILLRSRNAELWAWSYLKQNLKSRPPAEAIHLLVCLADHFEPYWGGVSRDQAHRRAERWCMAYPALADAHRDSWGKPPQHCHFYPQEQYDPEVLERLSDLCRRGYGDVEVHLHHDGDSPEALTAKLLEFIRVLFERHSFLRRNTKTGLIEYGFIHGNWALDNSRRDGKWCGVNNEISVLKQTGCYADFTLPSAPSDTQTTTINSIYFARDDPEKPKSHDTGELARVGLWDDEALLIVQGPLALDFRNRKWGLLPRIENGEISWNRPPSAARLQLWLERRIHVAGRPEFLFLKLHTHGMQDKNLAAFIEEGLLHKLYSVFEEWADGGESRFLHYISARQMYEIIYSLCTNQALGPGSHLEAIRRYL